MLTNFFALEQRLEAETLDRGSVQNDLAKVLVYHFQMQRLPTEDCPIFQRHIPMPLEILTKLLVVLGLLHLVILHKRFPFSLATQ